MYNTRMKKITKNNLESVITKNDKEKLRSAMLKANLYKDESILIKKEKEIINRYNKILEKNKKNEIDYSNIIVYFVLSIFLIIILIKF